MASEYLKLLSGEKVICNACKKGNIEPISKDMPIDKVNVFNCNHCGEQINITRKLKIL